MEPVDKPDPYGDWVLLGIKDGRDGPPLLVDEELLAAARKAWPRVLAHVRGELFDRELGPERTALAVSRCSIDSLWKSGIGRWNCQAVGRSQKAAKGKSAVNTEGRITPNYLTTNGYSLCSTPALPITSK